MIDSDWKSLRNPADVAAALRQGADAYQMRRADSALWPLVIEAMRNAASDIEAALPRNQK